MSDSHIKERLLKYFNFSEPGSMSGSVSLPLMNIFQSLQDVNDIPLTTINLEHIRSNDRVLIQATVGWQVTSTANQNPQIGFLIRRDGPGGPIVFISVDTTGNTAIGRKYTTALTCSETGLIPGNHSYTLTTVVQFANELVITGPVNLDAWVIDENGT